MSSAAPLPGRLNGLAARLEDADQADLQLFLERHFGTDSTQANPRSFAWRFRDTPHADGPPPVWICRRDGRIVGHQAGLPVRLRAGERDVAANWAIDLLVEPAWRLRGVAPALGAELQASAPLVCGLNISEAAHKTFRRAGWLDLGMVPRCARLIRPFETGTRPLGTHAADRRTAVASRIAAPLLSAYDAAALPLLRARTRLQPIARFDERADTVWRQAAPHYRVLARRDLACLRWRFDQAPQADAYDRHYLLRRGEPVGYLVTRQRGRSLMAVDYLCPPGEVMALFAQALMLARRSGALLLACLAQPPEIQRRLAPLGFARLKGPRFMIRIGDPSLRGLSDPRGWLLTDADSDLDHAI